MPSKKKQVYLCIAPSKHQGAILSLLRNYLNHFQLIETHDVNQADVQLCHGVEWPSHYKPDLPTAYIPIDFNSLIPKSLCSQDTPFPAPQALRLREEYSSFEFNFDLFSFLSGQLYRAEEYQSLYKENSFEARSTHFLGERYSTFDIPIVDLWMKWLFEKLLNTQIKTHWQQDQKYALWNTHDIDLLLYWTWKKSLKHLLLSPFLIIKNPKRWARTSRSFLKSKFKAIDPYSNLDKISRLENKLGFRSTFFVMGWPKDHRNRTYDILKKRFIAAFGETQKKHDLALHSSPLHTQDSDKLKLEKNRVQDALKVQVLASRQHFLFWDIRKTPHAHDEIGIKLDSTLGFNDRPGFRCGTCMPFKWYDLENKQELKLTQMPLILADHQMGSDHWLNPNKLLDTSFHYIEQIQQVGGIFSLLTHDLYFSEVFQPDMFQYQEKLLIKVSENARIINLDDLLPHES
jgi:peptidoglycan/xylan/chitin deacetylase (PgdA/CDA1 family)